MADRPQLDLEEAVRAVRIGVGQLAAPAVEPGPGRLARGAAGGFETPRPHRVCLEELRRPGVVEHEIVQHQQPRDTREVLVQEGVSRTVAHLVDRGVVGSLALSIGEDRLWLDVALRGQPRAIDRLLGVEHVDLVPVGEQRQHVGRVVRDPGGRGRQG